MAACVVLPSFTYTYKPFSVLIRIIDPFESFAFTVLLVVCYAFSFRIAATKGKALFGTIAYTYAYIGPTFCVSFLRPTDLLFLFIQSIHPRCSPTLYLAIPFADAPAGGVQGTKERETCEPFNLAFKPKHTHTTRDKGW